MSQSFSIRRVANPSDAPDLHPEDLARARWYRFFSRVFADPPDAALLELLAGQADAPVPSDNDSASQALDQAWRALARASIGAAPDRVAEEFDSLFLGVGKAPVAVHASWYLSGFLNERPLAELRALLDDIGLRRREDSSRTEDHIASLCEIMAVLIESGSGAGEGPLDLQRRVFEHYLAPCYESFTRAVDANSLASWYAPASAVLNVFLDIERQAFDFDD